MPEKSDPIAHNGKQNVLVYHTRQHLLKFPQGGLAPSSCRQLQQPMRLQDSGADPRNCEVYNKIIKQLMYLGLIQITNFKGVSKSQEMFVR